MYISDIYTLLHFTINLAQHLWHTLHAYMDICVFCLNVCILSKCLYETYLINKFLVQINPPPHSTFFSFIHPFIHFHSRFFVVRFSLLMQVRRLSMPGITLISCQSNLDMLSAKTCQNSPSGKEDIANNIHCIMCLHPIWEMNKFRHLPIALVAIYTLLLNCNEYVNKQFTYFFLFYFFPGAVCISQRSEIRRPVWNRCPYIRCLSGLWTKRQSHIGVINFPKLHCCTLLQSHCDGTTEGNRSSSQHYMQASDIHSCSMDCGNMC